MNLQDHYFDWTAQEQVKVIRKGLTAFVYFDSVYGGLSTEQCRRLREQLIAIKASDAKVIVLNGGEHIWCSGMDLYAIEASEMPADETWHNITAVNELILELMDTPNQLTIAAVANDAAADGMMLALACDEVIVRQGVTLNPHFKGIGLSGSAYWTYLLPKRVGRRRAEQIVDEGHSMSAGEAIDSEIADMMLAQDPLLFEVQLKQYLARLYREMDFAEYLGMKTQWFEAQYIMKPLEAFACEELGNMKADINNLASAYHEKRRDFVYQVKKARQSAMA